MGGGASKKGLKGSSDTGPAPAPSKKEATALAAAPSPESSSNKKGGAVYRTSNGCSTPELSVELVRLLLEQAGVACDFDEEAPTFESVDRLVKSHASLLGSLKVLVLNDSAFFMNPTRSLEMRAKMPRMMWDLKMAKDFGVSPENVTVVELYSKPWMSDAGDARVYDTCWDSGNRHALAWSKDVDAEDEVAWREMLEKAEALYAQLKKGEAPLVSSPSFAAGLLAESERIDQKYAARLASWWQRTSAGLGLICGSGGDVVMLNLAYQLHRTVADGVRAAVHENGVVYMGRSAGTMVTAKSMEMTSEIQPGWLEHFSCGDAYKRSASYSPNDLDGDGVHGSVLGGLHLTDAPFAIRPHFDAASFAAEVLAKNLTAEAEFERETGKEVDDVIVASSSGAGGAGDILHAVKLLEQLAENAADQDNPVYIPIWDGCALSVRISPQGKESYKALSGGMPAGWHEAEYFERRNG